MKITKTIPVNMIISAIIILSLGWNGVIAITPAEESQENILYVKENANGDCLSWVTACHLQSALGKALAGDQIWVAEGTYQPTTGTDRTISFDLISGVEIYGGFPSTGGDWDDRDWKVNETILSGDIGIIGDDTDNSYHVVTGRGVDVTGILDGFTISAGNANGSFPDNYGGGIFNDFGSPTLSNMNIADNKGSFGGGLSNINSSNPKLSNVTFIDNLASLRGGGMYNKYTSSPTLTDVVFSRNSAYVGGGIANNNNSSPIIMRSTFIENSAVGGGGIWNYNNANSTLVEVTFLNNLATSGGGGMSNEESNPFLYQVSFVGNSAPGGGGMFFGNCGSGSILQNVTFSDNSANNKGGGLYNHYSSPMLINVTFSGNSSYYDGGGIYNEYNSKPIMTNSILWGNMPDQIYNDSSSSMSATYSLIQRGYEGEGNIDSNPLLGDLKNNGGLTQTYALQPDSPAIDVGNPDPDTCPDTDQRGMPRPVDGNGDGLARCDMGAFELQPHNLTIDIVGNGEVNVIPDQPDYNNLQEVYLTANPEPGWSFASWSGDVTSTDNPLQVTITGDINVTATFTQNEYSLEVHVSPANSGTVSIDPDKTIYHYGDEVTLTAHPEPSWSFAGWSGDSTGTVNPLTVTIQENTNITATFTQNEYTLGVIVSPIGSGTVSLDPDKTTYHYGDEVTLTAHPEPGWSFAGWSGDETGTDNRLQITIVGDTNITASFTQIEYTLEVDVFPADSGTISIDPKITTYHYADEVTLTANPEPGWSFASWSGDVTSTDNPLQVTITGDINVTASFTQNEHTLEVVVSPADSGTILIDPEKTTYHYGDEVTLTAFPKPGWIFLEWSGDAMGIDNPLTVVIQGKTNVSALFTDEKFKIFLPLIFQ